MDGLAWRAAAKELAQQARLGAAWLSDALGAMSWLRFMMWVILGSVLIGALPKWIVFAPLKELLPAAIIFCALLKAQAKSRRDAARSRDEARREAGAANAKAMALEARLDPHFLFNAMATVEQLIVSDAGAAARVQRALTIYLRSGLGTAAASTVASQAKACEAYLEIQSVRMGERLSWSSAWSCFEQPMPGRVAIGLLETAVALGVESALDGGTIELSCGPHPKDPRRLAWIMRCPSRGLDGAALEPWRDAWLAQAGSPSWSQSLRSDQLELELAWRREPLGA